MTIFLSNRHFGGGREPDPGQRVFWRGWFLAFAGMTMVLGLAVEANATSFLRDCARVNERGGPYQADECYEHNLKVKEEWMLAAYQAALRFLRASSAEHLRIPQDRPSLKLIRSQTGWKERVYGDCEIRADLVGGAGPWRDRRARDCYVSEVESRTAFLEKIVGGSYDEWN